MRAAKVQASLRIRAVSPEPPLLTHTSSESRGTFRQKARSLAPLNGWACPIKICNDGMLEDTNSLDGAPMMSVKQFEFLCHIYNHNDLKFGTDSSEQTVWTKIWVYTICHSICIFWTNCLLIKPHYSNFRFNFSCFFTDFQLTINSPSVL